VNPQWAYAVAGRVGYAFDRLLPYVFGGIGVTKVEVHSDVTNITQDNTYRGPVVGAGFEYAVHRHVSLDFRYMYSSAPLKDYNFGGGIEQYGGRASSYLASVNFRF
jgi:outer membrane immunogenic protein